MTTARAMLETPYAVEHQASVRSQFLRGSKRKDLLGWFVTEFAREVPLALHGMDVFVGRPDRENVRRDASLLASQSQPADLVGGSKLGSPRLSEVWRAYIEDAPDHHNQDGYYVRPIHAALARVSGRPGTTGKYPFMARYLLNVALATGDWRTVSEKWGMLIEVGEVYTQAALDHLWLRYSEQTNN